MAKDVMTRQPDSGGPALFLFFFFLLVFAGNSVIGGLHAFCEKAKDDEGRQDQEKPTDDIHDEDWIDIFHELKYRLSDCGD